MAQAIVSVRVEHIDTAQAQRALSAIVKMREAKMFDGRLNNALLTKENSGLPKESQALFIYLAAETCRIISIKG